MGWEREIGKHTRLVSARVPNGRKAALEWLKENRNGDWDILRVHPENLIGAGSNSQGDITKLLKSMKWDLIVIDEAHYYKNLQSKRTDVYCLWCRNLRIMKVKPQG